MPDFGHLSTAVLRFLVIAGIRLRFGLQKRRYNAEVMRVLIIEDDENISRLLKDSLKTEFFAVDSAADGEKGSHLAQINDYDLIILDHLLPKKDGLAVIREIRAKKIAVPILLLSVRGAAAHKAQLLDAGADDYLAKPFSLDELMARIRALLRRPAVLKNDIYKIGDLALDVKKCAVCRGGKDIYLTRKEFMLLHYLMQHEGVVLSRGAILEHVWDMNTDIFSNTIESHILSLRKKIGDMGKHRLIQTIPGRGYKIGY